MNRELKTSLIHFAIAAAGIVAFVVINGCVPVATIARQDGFNAQWRGFAAIPATPGLYREAEIRVKVIIVGDQSAIGYPGAAETYSHPQGVVRIIGKLSPDGKVILCEAVIGHAILHALQFQDGGFVNPDKITEYGY